VAKKYDILLMVDDATAMGSARQGRRGIVDRFACTASGHRGRHHVEGFGVMGGVVAGDKVIVEWLRSADVRSCSLSHDRAGCGLACIAAVDLLEESTELVDKLWKTLNISRPKCRTGLRYRRK